MNLLLCLTTGQPVVKFLTNSDHNMTLSFVWRSWSEVSLKKSSMIISELMQCVEYMFDYNTNSSLKVINIAYWVMVLNSYQVFWNKQTNLSKLAAWPKLLVQDLNLEQNLIMYSTLRPHEGYNWARNVITVVKPCWSLQQQGTQNQIIQPPVNLWTDISGHYPSHMLPKFRV